MYTRILFLGDSVAAEPTVGFVPMTVRILTNTIDVSVSSVNSSVPSSNVLDLLDRVQELLPTQADPFAVACILVGINDSKILAQFHEPLVPLELFGSRLRMLVERLEGTGSSVALCGLPDLHFARIRANETLREFWYWKPADYHAYTAVIRDLAAESRARAFIDLDAAFKAAPPDTDALFGPDGVHPSALGHAVIADAVSAGLAGLLQGNHCTVTG
jgi:lysophospholipase L1-like esterase